MNQPPNKRMQRTKRHSTLGRRAPRAVVADLRFAADPQRSADTRTRCRKHRQNLLVVTCAFVAMAPACARGPASVPPVKIQPRILCEPPKPAPSNYLLPLTPPPGTSCGLPDLRCDELRPLVIRVDEGGHITEAFVPRSRSPGVDACVLSELRATGRTFEPARDCNGTPMPGEYSETVGIVCGNDA